MNLKELDSFKLSDAVTFHDHLNPALWAGHRLKPAIKEQLLIIAKDFLEELGVDDLDVVDITISGSNAAYSYTKHSDLDLHILVDTSKLNNDEIYKELFNAKKTLYNDSHHITINNVPVELYVQDASEPVVSLGEYSILHDDWLRLPTKRRANFDQTATKEKYAKLQKLIEVALLSKDIHKVQAVLKTIKRYRQAGLDRGGEFGPENLAFKALRSQGYITKLYALRDKLHSEVLTIETMYQDPVKVQRDKLEEKLSKEFEDYHPNGKPPGPEFKPTMPAGTVKVDVSDTYDWYKLGQHISNLKGLGKHDFGAGPPSTILSFGDENTEHKYIKDLEKTGLTTTDIDPVDPKQPKGMKRQKVDPTYNVNEGFDQPYPFTWEKGDHGDLDALAKLPDGSPLSIMFNQQQDDDGDEITQVEFYRNNSQEVTGEGDAQRIFATVLSAIQTYVKKYKPVRLTFSASKQVDPSTYYEPDEPQPNPESRAKLYDRLVQRYAKAWGYRAFRADNGDLVIYELSRIKPAVAKEDTMQYASEKTSDINPYGGQRDRQYRGSISEASGYIPSEKEKNDPRFKTALTVDIKPDSIKKNAKAFAWLTDRAGIPPTANPNGKF
jgi:nitroreductase